MTDSSPLRNDNTAVQWIAINRMDNMSGLDANSNVYELY